MGYRSLSKLEQRFTDDDRIIRIGVITFGSMAALVLAGLGVSEFAPNQCANAMLERRATNVQTVDGSCLLTFGDGSMERFDPSPYAGFALVAAVAIVLAVLSYVALDRRRSRIT